MDAKSAHFLKNPGPSDAKKLAACKTMEELDTIMGTQVYTNIEGREKFKWRSSVQNFRI